MTDTLTTAADLLRPDTFDTYVGQDKLKARLNVHIESALNRARPMEHVLLYGPAGSGKTSLAYLIAQRFALPFLALEMPLANGDYRDLRGFGGVLFLDEIHRGSKSQQEELMPLLEHGYMRPKGRGRMDFPWITVIGATTELAKIISPLRQKFTIAPHFDAYTDEELGLIVRGMCERIGVDLTTDDMITLGKASLGIPRRASHFVQAARDLAVANHRSTTATEVLKFMRVTPEGFTIEHVEYMRTLEMMGDPVGMVNLKALLSASEETIREVEIPLIRRALVELTKQGRYLTNEGLAALAALPKS